MDLNKSEAMAILGVGDMRDAHGAMRALVKIHHPDHGGKAETFQLIIDAHRLLTDKTYRFNVERLSFGHPFTERVFQQKLISAMRADGALCIKIVGNVFQKIGIPDLYVASKIWTGWLELKTENEELRPHQAKMICKLNERGVPALVARYRRRHGVFLEKVDGLSASPIMLVKNWEVGFLKCLEQQVGS